MSHSKEDRLENVHLALNLFLNKLDSQWIGSFSINAGDADFECINATTWLELTKRFYYIQEIHLHRNWYRLTEPGWVEAFRSLKA